MSDPRTPPARTACRLWFLALGVVACWLVGEASAALRIEAEGVDPFVIEAAVTEDNTAWYDAEGWLRHFPGVITRDTENHRLNYREGELWISLRAQPPYALRNGLTLEGIPPVRLDGDTLMLSEQFLRRAAGALLGRRVLVQAAGQQEGRRVVLDAGHGGDEPGSRGEAVGTPTAEKTVTLALALATAEKLREAGFAVHLTRSGDHSISAEKRAAVANYWGADLFLSFHAAGEGRPQARGFEVFVAPAPGATADAQRWEAGQSGHAEASRRWAAALRASLGSTLATFDRGVTVAPSPLLEAVACPAALVEAGTLAWPGDSEVLTTKAGRERIAAAVVVAVQDFFSAAPQ